MSTTATGSDPVVAQGTAAFDGFHTTLYPAFCKDAMNDLARFSVSPMLHRTHGPGTATKASAHMAPMTTLDETYMFKHPVQHRITRLDTEESIHYYGRTYDNYPRPDGTFELPSTDYVRRFSQPEDTYLVEVLDDKRQPTGEFNLLNGEEFRESLTPHEEPYFEYGVWFKPRRNDVVVHGSKEAAQTALDELPVLKESGNYAIVRRIIYEPGYWEEVR